MKVRNGRESRKGREGKVRSEKSTVPASWNSVNYSSIYRHCNAVRWPPQADTSRIPPPKNVIFRYDAGMFLVSITGITAIVSVVAGALADQFLGSGIPLIGSYVSLELSHNSGIAFGLRLPPMLQSLLIGVALVVVAFMAVRSMKYRPKSSLAYGLILGGGIANIVDRLADGLVTDYVRIGTFPVFNAADACITIGVGLLLWEMFLRR